MAVKPNYVQPPGPNYLRTCETVEVVDERIYFGEGYLAEDYWPENYWESTIVRTERQGRTRLIKTLSTRTPVYFVLKPSPMRG